MGHPAGASVPCSVAAIAVGAASAPLCRNGGGRGDHGRGWPCVELRTGTAIVTRYKAAMPGIVRSASTVPVSTRAVSMPTYAASTRNDTAMICRVVCYLASRTACSRTDS